MKSEKPAAKAVCPGCGTPVSGLGGETISNGTRMGSRPTVCVLVDCIENDQTKAS